MGAVQAGIHCVLLDKEDLCWRGSQNGEVRSNNAGSEWSVEYIKCPSNNSNNIYLLANVWRVYFYSDNLVLFLYETICVSTPRAVRIVLSHSNVQLQFRSRQKSLVLILYHGAATPNVETNTSLLIFLFSQHRYRFFLVLLTICKYIVFRSLVFLTNSPTTNDNYY